MNQCEIEVIDLTLSYHNSKSDINSKEVID